MRIVENIKSIILTVLILSSLVLTGSLWFDNYQGLSLVLSNVPVKMSGVSGLSEQDYSKRYDELIAPYKVILVAGEDGRWIVYQTNETYNKAWSLMKEKLNLVDANAELITGEMNEWKELVSRKSIIVEFGTTMDFDMLKMIAPNLDEDKREYFNNVEKIAITKSIDGGVIYLCQKVNGKSMLSKILLADKLEALQPILDEAENQKANSKYVTLSETGTNKFYGNKIIEPADDVLFPVSNKQDKREKVYKITSKSSPKANDEYSRNKLVTTIFESTDFAKFVTNEGGTIYINDDKSSIQFEGNNIMKYENNRKKVSEDIPSTSTSFDAAIDFINKLGIYENIYLLGMSEKDGEFIFDFGTSISSIPVAFYDKKVVDSEKVIAEVKVKDGVVKEFVGKLVTFTLTNENQYITQFAHNILDNILAEMAADETMKIDRINVMYDASIEGSSYPSWLVNYRVGNEKGESIIKTTKK